MDQNTALLESKCSINLSEVITFRNEKKKVARRRWAILAKALKSPSTSEPSSPTDEYSLRRISSFMLLKTHEIETVLPKEVIDPYLIDQINKRTWYKYSTQVGDVVYYLFVGHRNRTFSAEDLMGFNNTGNVCIWPSEETLSYYVCSNLQIFKSKNVLELGGGMSCLAGLFAAKYASPASVVVTDGNKISVENAHITLQCNEFNCSVTSYVLKWGRIESDRKFDVILCADCLFFDEARADLIECILSLLAPDGTALVMAPRRGNTLRNFIKQSEAQSLSCNEVFNYNCIVWERRLALLDNCDYNDDIHYPILIEVTKV